jgi:hypothetical protein
VWDDGNGGRFKTLPQRVEMLEKIKEPNSYEEAERLIGMLGWHRDFIEGEGGGFAGLWNQYIKCRRWRDRERNGGRK